MKTAKDLSHQQLVAVVDRIQDILWFDSKAQGRGKPAKFFWNPDKQWEAEFVEMIASQLEDQGLRPDEVEEVP